jgi:hypothetical protein
MRRVLRKLPPPPLYEHNQLRKKKWHGEMSISAYYFVVGLAVLLVDSVHSCGDSRRRSKRKKESPAYLPKNSNHRARSMSSSGRRAFWTFWNALWLSTALLFKIGFRDTRVSGRFLGIDLRHIVLVEWLFGYLVIAGLTSTLASTQPLLNNLVKGLF